MRRMVAKVKLFAREMKWCQKHAEKIVNHYGGHGSKGSGAYNHNKISSNMEVVLGGNNVLNTY